MLVGKLEARARALAYLLLTGSTAAAVEGQLLRGVTLSYMEIDGHPVELPRPHATEAPGVLVRLPDGSNELYLAANRGQALAFLGRAKRLAADLRDSLAVEQP